MAAIEPYYFEQNMLQLTMMKIVSSIDDSEVDNVLGKKNWLTLWRMQSQLQVFLLLTNF